MADETLYAFDRADSKALLAMIGSRSTSGAIGDPREQSADILLGVTTSTITARVGTTLGTGTARAKMISSSNVLSDLFSSDHTVSNPGSAIANGAYVLMFRSGARYLVVEIC